MEIAEKLVETTDQRWWIRERAVRELVEAGEGYRIDPVALSETPVRGRYKGRFCQTRHVNSLYGVVLDSNEVSHSVWFCPAASDKGRWTNDIHSGWLCGPCIHTQDWSERAQSERYLYLLTEKPAKLAPTRELKQYQAPKGHRAQVIISIVAEAGAITAEDLIQAVGRIVSDNSTATPTAIYMLFRGGALAKSGRGKKATYTLAA